MTPASIKNETDLKRWHLSILLFFSVFAISSMSIMVRLPEVRQMLGVSVSTLGVLLFMGAVGSITSLSLVGRFIARFGTKPAIIGGMIGFFVSGFALMLSAYLHSPIMFGIAAFFYGFCAGAADVGINVDGAEIEQRLGRSALPRMHAGYSIGAFLGAGAGTVAITLGVELFWQVLILATLSLIVPVIFSRLLPSKNGVDAKHNADASADAKASKVFISAGIIALCAGIFGITIAEGAANDWLAIGLVDDYRVSPEVAGLGFAVFNLSMTIFRFFGGNLFYRFWRVRLLQILVGFGIIGLLLIILSHNIVLAIVGAALWGAGVALGFPLFISAAAEAPGGARTVAFVTTSGYFAFLVGPPLLGFVADELNSMLTMFWLLAIGLIAAFFAARATKGNAHATPAQIH
ncbi:MAG: MFS transporter [Micrococcales bacterium]